MSNLHELNPSQYCSILIIGLAPSGDFNLARSLYESTECGVITTDRFTNSSSSSSSSSSGPSSPKLLSNKILNGDRVVVVAEEVTRVNVCENICVIL